MKYYYVYGPKKITILGSKCALKSPLWQPAVILTNGVEAYCGSHFTKSFILCKPLCKVIYYKVTSDILA